jgi:hypothetical protein
MTVLTDTQVITASGGLVELGYVERTTDATSTATTLAAASNLFSTNLTFVADGSPVMVEFFGPRWVNSSTSFGKISLVNGSGTEIGLLTLLAGSSQEDTSPKYRYTPSAGVQTLNVKMVSYDGTTVTMAAGAGGAGVIVPMFLRVSKIVQATQWPAVTTGTIICTSSTRPASPFVGQVIYETDSGRSYIHNGTAWVAPQVQTNPPICRAYATGTQSLANSTVTAITLGSESYDTDTMHSTVSNTSRITFTTAGVYSLIGEATFDINATGTRDIYLFLNGTTRISEATAPSSGASTYSQLQVGAQYSFAANDYVEMYAWQNSGGSLNLRGDVSNGVWLAAQFVGKSS